MKQVLFLTFAVLTFTPLVSHSIALLLGIGLALSMGNPFADQTRLWTSKLLQICVVGLGAGMNLSEVAQVGIQGLGYTFITIAITLATGLLLGRILKVDPTSSLLVSVGTAICGGSAIAAVAATTRAKSEQVSVALATVFFLNAIALFIFPHMGHTLGLSPHTFGLWSALAIHDTSSVVGAAIMYSPLSVGIATTVKLARALWIVPVSLGVAWFWNRDKKQPTGSKNGLHANQGIKVPWFIFGFLLAATITTYLPVLAPVGFLVHALAKKGLVFTLFLIGSGLTQKTLRAVGPAPLFQGLLLWLVSGSVALLGLTKGWIQ